MSEAVAPSDPINELRTDVEPVPAMPTMVPVPFLNPPTYDSETIPLVILLPGKFGISLAERLIVPPSVRLPLVVTVPLSVMPETEPVPLTLVTVPPLGVAKVPSPRRN